jgi:hypothetical protein
MVDLRIPFPVTHSNCSGMWSSEDAGRTGARQRIFVAETAVAADVGDHLRVAAGSLGLDHPMHP